MLKSTFERRGSAMTLVAAVGLGALGISGCSGMDDIQYRQSESANEKTVQHQQDVERQALISNSISSALAEKPSDADCSTPQPLGKGAVSTNIIRLFPDMGALDNTTQHEATWQSAQAIWEQKPDPTTLVQACDEKLTGPHNEDFGHALLAYTVIETN